MAALAATACALTATPTRAAPPEIRLSPTNYVPACVTPERLMAFLKTRNESLDRRYADVARWYRHHGEAWRVRWDYAFFQMLLETNFLTYRRGDGRWGDVDPRQNNFAGIGTTGGGVPGDSYPDIKTGVLAQIQHLVAYSGEKLAQPVAPRTQLKQDDIVEVSLRLRRPVTFADLARRWAVDPKYGRSIEFVADSFRSRYCTGQDAFAPPPAPRIEASMGLAPKAPAPRPAVRTAAVAPPPQQALRGTREPQQPPAAAGRDNRPPAAGCTVDTASYGGSTTTLIRSADAGRVRYTALSVIDGFERSMTDSFIRSRAPGGERIGTFVSKEAALAHARELCPGS